MKSYISTIIFLLVITGNLMASQILTLSAPNNPVQNCDSVAISIGGTHYCSNDYITSMSHSVAGSVITITVNVSTGICIPPTTLPTFSTIYMMPVSAMPTGSYNIRGTYNTTLSSATDSLDLIACCARADAGNDTSLCDVSSIQLSGNSIPVGATASWSVVGGTGTLVNPLLPNTVVNNLSYGANLLVWSMADTACSTTDTLTIENFETPSMAVTEPDRTVCEDTTTIHATAPTIGTGSWKAVGLGAILHAPNSPSSLVSFFIPLNYNLIWTVTNGICEDKDTLTISYVKLSSAPVISAAGLVLTSTPAPQYQWYMDSVAIPGETSMTYTVTSNGKYMVLGSVSGCSTGLFSNEIEFTLIGIDAISLSDKVVVSPNPTRGNVRISGLESGNQISLFQNDMKLVYQKRASAEIENIDLSGLNAGIYMIRITTNDGILSKRLVVLE